MDFFSTRLAEFNDASALARVHCESIRVTFTGRLDQYVAARSLARCEERWRERLTQPAGRTLVLLSQDKVVGFATVAPSEDEDVKGTAGEVDRIYIHPSAWGQGQGGVLISWCEDQVRSMDLKLIKLWVFAVNDRARRFYSKHGYKHDGATKRDFNADLLRYSKGL